MPVPVAVTEKLAVWPMVTDWLAGCVKMVGPEGFRPVPVSTSDGGDPPGSLLETTIVPEEVPGTVGAKLAENVRTSLGASVAGKVNPLVLKLEPVRVIWEIVMGALPVLVSDTGTVFLEPAVTWPKSTFVGLKLMPPGELAPVAPTHPVWISVRASRNTVAKSVRQFFTRGVYELSGLIRHWSEG